MTGGLQEQVTNGKEWFGWGIQPASKAVIGSLQVPYIYEDRGFCSFFRRNRTNVVKIFLQAATNFLNYYLNKFIV